MASGSAVSRVRGAWALAQSRALDPVADSERRGGSVQGE